MNRDIERIERWLQVERPAYFRRLRKGASSDDLKSLEALTGAVLPDSFKEFYLWRNGQWPSNRNALCNNALFMRLPEIEAKWDIMDQLSAVSDFHERRWWRPGWIPFLDDGGGNNLCIDLEGTFSGGRGQVISFRHNLESREVLFPTFSSFLATLASVLERTQWPKGEQSWHLPEEEIRRLNPGYPMGCEAEIPEHPPEPTAVRETLASPEGLEKVARLGIKQTAGFVYHVMGTEVWRTPLRRTGPGGGRPEKVADGDFVDEDGFVYFLDGEGDIARRRQS
jgi:cell wall assembly regulator SMI1